MHSKNQNIKSLREARLRHLLIHHDTQNVKQDSRIHSRVNIMSSECQAVPNNTHQSRNRHLSCLLVVHHIDHETRVLLTFNLFNWDHQRQEIKL